MTAVMWIGVGLSFAAIAFLGFALSGAIRAMDELRTRIAALEAERADHAGAGLSVGTRAPTFRATGATGSEFRSESLAGNRHLIVFSDPDCEACAALLPELVERGASLPTVVVSRGGGDGGLRSIWTGAIDATTDVRLVFDPRRAIGERFETTMSPHAFVIDEGGYVASQGAAGTLAEMEQLIHDAEGIRIVPGPEEAAARA
jgi:hypothetical protein